MGKDSRDRRVSAPTAPRTRVPREGAIGALGTGVGLKPLSGTADDVEAVQRVLESAPAYGLAMHGSPSPPENAAALFTSLPPGVDRSAKSVFGVFVDDEMIGCIDVVRGIGHLRRDHDGKADLTDRPSTEMRP